MANLAQPELMAKIEEYKALRAEILVAIDISVKTVTFLLAALGALLAAGVTALSQVNESGKLLAMVIFSFVIPTVSMFGILVWLGEQYRLCRASFYLSHLERSLGLTWESWLREGRRYFENHQATYIFFCLVGFVSFLFGLLCFPWSTAAKVALYGFVAIACAIFIFWIVFCCWGWNRIRELEKETIFRSGPVILPNRAK